MVEHLLRAPVFAFTELRTITEVTGMPPIKPETIFPVPCAQSSRFGGEERFEDRFYLLPLNSITFLKMQRQPE